jgi:hypothetical protein
MNEATLRDFFLAKATGQELAADLVGTVRQRSRDVRVVHIQDLASDEEFTITAPMMVRLCDAVLAGELPGPALEPIAFAVIASDHLHWAENDELVGRVLYAWASPEINWELTPENIQMFRQWFTGEVQPPPESEVTPEDMSGGRFLGRTEKAWIDREVSSDPKDEA